MDDERRWFETSDCSFWLKQFSMVFGYVYEERYLDNVNNGRERCIKIEQVK